MCLNFAVSLVITAYLDNCVNCYKLLIRLCKYNSVNEHSLNLRLEKELKELRKVADEQNELRRNAEIENTKLKTKNDDYRSEIAHLKKDIAELKKEKANTEWINKSEYEKLSQELKEKEKQLQRVQREIKE